MYSYKNGNYRVTIFNDGTKVRMTNDDEFIPAFSENCDVKITDKCSMGCSFCFVPGTLVHLKDCTKSIENVVLKDKVMSFNEDNRSIEFAQVDQIFVSQYDGDLIVISIDKTTIKCTTNHKIYISYDGGQTAAWVEAADIKIRKNKQPMVYLANVNGSANSWHLINSIDKEQYDGYVYNIGVKGNHTYYVGTDRVLVHNCYEGCTADGKHADFTKYDNLINSLHPYTEMALNGNDLDIPGFDTFLEKLKDKKVFANITVHQYQFMKNFDYIKKLQDAGLIHGVGVSLANSANKEFIEKLGQIKNTVLHVINGLFTETDYENLKDHNIKILFLGYKHLKRGDVFYNENKNIIDNRIEWLGSQIMDITNHFKVVSFDNLSLNQLDIKSKLDPAKWEEFYMGDDGGFTFYIDLVAGTFSKNSISQDRYEIGNKTIDDMFNVIHNVQNNEMDTNIS